MYYRLGFPELVSPASAGAPPLPAQPLLLLKLASVLRPLANSGGAVSLPQGLRY